MDRTAAFYSHPSYQHGGGTFAVFSGSRRQRGGGVLGSIAQAVVPSLKSVGKAVGRSALKQAVGLASDVAGDVLAGRNIGASLKTRGKARLLNVARTAGTQGLKAMQNVLSGNRKRPAQPNTRHPAAKKRRVVPPKRRRRRGLLF